MATTNPSQGENSCSTTFGSFAPPPPFMSCPGTPSIPWKQWKKMFTNYMLVCDGDRLSSARQKAILLHSLGPEGQLIYYTLPESDPTDNQTLLEHTILMLDNQFLPAVNVVAERFRFRQRTQMPGESIENYISALRDLASTCDFGTMHDEMLRDQLIEKTIVPRIQERLLLEINVTLPKALELARQVERVIKESKDMTASASTDVRFVTKSNVRQKSYHQKQSLCYRCGSSEHLANSLKCKARTAACNECHKTGHFASVCRGSETKSKTVKFVESTDEFQVLTVSNAKHGLYCNVQINLVDMTLLVDSGSPVSILTNDCYLKHFSNIQLTQSTIPLTSFTRDKIKVLGTFSSDAIYKGVHHSVQFLVVDGGTSLIGFDLIRQFKLQIDGENLVCNQTCITAEPMSAPSGLPEDLKHEFADLLAHRSEGPTYVNAMMSKDGKPVDLDVDSIIEQLLSVRNIPGKQVQLPETQIRQLCQVSRSIFLDQPMLVELEAPVNISGDIHGQYEDLLRHFDKLGFPPEANYLFLGDYVDRGKRSLETICLVLAYKIKYPNNFFLLRGNHECASINRIYGFYDECKRRYNIKLWKTFTDCFNCLPIAALVESTVLCMHGGLSPDLTDLDQLREIERPLDVPDHGMVCDLLWSDPDEDVTGWGENDRGVSYTFGGDIVRSYLKRFDCSLVVRAHQVVEDGYQFFQKRKLVTLFSAPNYCGEFDNAAAVMIMSDDLTCSFSILPPDKGKVIAIDPKNSKK